MSDDGAFGFDSEDLDRMIREAGEGLRAAFDRFAGGVASAGGRAGWGAIFADLAQAARSGPPTTGETGDGVWAIYTVGDDGAARVEQVYATELDALRASQRNPDPKRKVRFLPYGIAVGVLDDSAGENE
ncbi:hypothetical protein EHH44_21395 [Mycolicibacter terrae]|uniref:Transmembrane protein n=2 Tax=Mycolicibacter TaxID=1073531 RepID=A0A1A2NNE7_MYCSD|nr:MULTISPECIES: hypothetical protein [Mycolicibacter]OBH16598.1 hypothetical protein A5694_06205 [Mycolicibacter sinensis]OBI31313.1 hypothetical protein A5710_18255 [Mycolicibacter sinensis]RRR39873.1 hypothetical protein EHH44_21395 [Mycolicibacter terrae]